MQVTVVYGAPTPPGRLATAVDHVARFNSVPTGIHFDGPTRDCRQSLFGD